MILKLLSSNSKLALLMGLTTSSPILNSWLMFEAWIMTRPAILKPEHFLEAVQHDSEDIVRRPADDGRLGFALAAVFGFVARDGLNAVYLAGRQIRDNHDVLKRQRRVLGRAVIKGRGCRAFGKGHLAGGQL